MSSSADRGDSASGSTSGSPKSRGTPTGAQPALPLTLTAKSRAVSTQDMAPQLDGAVKVLLLVPYIEISALGRYERAFL